MSTAPLLRSTYTPADESASSEELSGSDQRILELANQDECVVKRTSGARGVMAGLTLGALLWAGIIWASATLIK